MLKAVIFDVDGTLLDTERIYIRAWKEAGALLGYEVTDEVLLKTRAIKPTVAAKIFESEIGNGFNYMECRAKRVLISEEIIAKESPILKPGVPKLLNYLKEKGVRMAVASSTNTKHTREHLALSGIADYFEVFVGGDMVEHGKPAPDIFLMAAEMLGVEPTDCMVAEDSPAGIEAAFRAGMRPVLVPDCVMPTEEMRKMSYLCVDSLEQLPGFLEPLL